MNFDEFQQAAHRTWNVDWTLEEQRENALLGLTGEAGECAEWRKKTRFHGHPMDLAALKKELGDTLHYVSAVATLYGLSLDDIAQDNIAKLWIRYPNGFSQEDSRQRRDKDTEE